MAYAFEVAEHEGQPVLLVHWKLSPFWSTPPDHPMNHAADITPALHARETWFPRSQGSPFTQARFRTNSFNFISPFFISGFCLFSAVNVFSCDIIQQELGFRDARYSNLVPGILGSPKSVSFNTNARHSYPLHRSPRVHKIMSRSTRTCYLRIGYPYPSCARFRV